MAIKYYCSDESMILWSEQFGECPEVNICCISCERFKACTKKCEDADKECESRIAGEVI